MWATRKAHRERSRSVSHQFVFFCILWNKVIFFQLCTENFCTAFYSPKWEAYKTIDCTRIVKPRSWQRTPTVTCDSERSPTICVGIAARSRVHTIQLWMTDFMIYYERELPKNRGAEYLMWAAVRHVTRKWVWCVISVTSRREKDRKSNK